MFKHLVVGLHENEGAVRAKFVFVLFRNRPAFFVVIADLTVIGTNSLKLNLNFAFH